MNKNKTWNSLEHDFWKSLHDLGFENRNFLVALSGGLDSMSLLSLFHQTSPRNLRAMYIHHGDQANREYRDRALIVCEEVCRQWQVPLIIEKVSPASQSENELREARYGCLRKSAEENQAILVTAHHQDDLLESRLLHLIRGCGPEGIVGMRSWDVHRQLWRPLLGVTRGDLEQYSQNRKLRYCIDPTNSDSSYKRNFLRTEWLPALENRFPGSLTSFARSLETLNEALQEKPQLEIGSVLSWSQYLILSRPEQLQILANYCVRLGKTEFSRSQITEVQKQLDKSQKNHTFTVNGLKWTVHETYFQAEPLAQVEDPSSGSKS